MRDIKFRAWDGISDEMLSMEEIEISGMNLFVLLATQSLIKVMQYTGLNDKNGKEIYESDYLRIHQFLFDGNEFENELTGEVVYDNETCSFALKNIVNDGVKKYMGYQKDEDCGNIPIFNFYGLHEESFEVVGNIYEQVGDTP